MQQAERRDLDGLESFVPNSDDEEEDILSQGQLSSSEGLPSMRRMDLGQKAGMDNVDQKKINQTIVELSKDSKYFQNEQEKERQTNLRIAEMKRQLQEAEGDFQVMNEACVAVDALVASFEQSRNLHRIWLHVDMDAFYIACEIRENPSLKDKPCCVGHEKSIISTSNYVARKFGVRSAMAGFIAKKLCPDLVFLPHNFQLYRSVADQVQEIFVQFDPDFEAMSLDEAYLDLTEYCERENVSPGEAAHRVRHAIFARTRLTASAGAAPNKMLAKIASDYRKPNGQYVVPPDLNRIMDFISPLPVRKVSGIGRVTAAILQGLGVHTVADLWENRYRCWLAFSPVSAEYFIRVAMAVGETEHFKHEARKSVSRERTFAPTADVDKLARITIENARAVARDLEDVAMKGKTVTVKMKTDNFKVLTRSLTNKRYTADAETICEAALSILHQHLPLSLRLLGVRVSNLLPKDEPDGPTPAAGQVLLTAFLQAQSQSQPHPPPLPPPHSPSQPGADSRGVDGRSGADGSGDVGPKGQQPPPLRIETLIPHSSPPTLTHIPKDEAIAAGPEQNQSFSPPDINDLPGRSSPPSAHPVVAVADDYTGQNALSSDMNTDAEFANMLGGGGEEKKRKRVGAGERESLEEGEEGEGFCCPVCQEIFSASMPEDERHAHVDLCLRCPAQASSPHPPPPVHPPLPTAHLPIPPTEPQIPSYLSTPSALTEAGGGGGGG
eukprot:GCRY01003705.1.p1 GENE.GCRY01003705.1~~GCRY01003705.1.p1  ORF type:complete len:724 (+),score=168.70 GCRY01003705.1:161-2332(+)